MLIYTYQYTYKVCFINAEITNPLRLKNKKAFIRKKQIEA